MAWPGKEPTQEEILKSLGMTKEQFDAMKSKADKADTLEASLTTQGTEMASIKASLAALEGRVSAPPSRNNGGGNNEDGSGGAPNLRDWNEDADGAFTDRVKPLVGLTLTVQAELVFNRVFKRMTKQSPIYSTLEADAQALVSAQPLNVQINEAVVENCFKVAYANNASQIAADQLAKSGKFFMETGSNQGSGPIADGKKAQLTEAEKKAASQLGVTEDKYLEMKAGINIAG